MLINEENKVIHTEMNDNFHFHGKVKSPTIGKIQTSSKIVVVTGDVTIVFFFFFNDPPPPNLPPFPPPPPFPFWVGAPGGPGPRRGKGAGGRPPRRARRQRGRAGLRGRQCQRRRGCGRGGGGTAGGAAGDAPGVLRLRQQRDQGHPHRRGGGTREVSRRPCGHARTAPGAHP